MRWFAIVGWLAFSGVLAGCQGGSLTERLQSGGARTANAGATGGGGIVALSPNDLAPVDAYIHTRNSQWILGDEVDVFASREYFAQVLSLNEKVGLVHRKEERVGADTLVTMTYVGHPGAASAMANPRVMIGTGLTASARKTLRVRMMKTTDPRVPVQLRIVARGQAVRGRKEEVTHRAQHLEIGGTMRWTGAAWQWSPYER